VSTIRYWIKEGLLEVAEITNSGYHIYSIAMIERCKQKKILKQKRHTLDKIRKFF
jgi:DNA-binding transcriptional MerR regulator